MLVIVTQDETVIGPFHSQRDAEHYNSDILGGKGRIKLLISPQNQ